MKIASPDITHKSEVDGVRLGIRGGRDVGPIFHDLVDTARARRPEARISGVTLEPMHTGKGGRELMLGVINDAVFGPVISVGLGGSMVEIIGDRAIGLPPLNRLLARRMIEGSRAVRLLAEFKGQPPVETAALEDALLRLSDIVCELPWIEQLDINPLVVSDSGVLAVDARVILRSVAPSGRRYEHMAIHPYPVDLVREHRLRDGTRIMIRPIRPEDAVLERDFVNGLSEQSRYLRFMYSLKAITPELVSKFTQIDYDREMALIALHGDGQSERQIGVGRCVDDRDGRGCDFAIVVADDWQGKGIASELLQRLIDIARNRRLEFMEGIVLRENRNMIELAKNHGFEARAVPDDTSLLAITLRL
jgi:acetyltransferase